MADPLERVTLAVPMAEGLLLDPTADFIANSTGEHDDMELNQLAGDVF